MSCSCPYDRAFFHGYGNLSCDLHKKLEDLSQIGACERTAAGQRAGSLCGEPKESFDETDLSDDVASVSRLRHSRSADWWSSIDSEAGEGLDGQSVRHGSPFG